MTSKGEWADVPRASRAFQLLRRELLPLIARFSSPGVDPEDVFSETIMRVIPHLQGIEHPVAYALRIAKRVAEEERKRRRRFEDLSSASVGSYEDSVLENCERSELLRSLYRALNETDRRLLTLVYEDGMNAYELADRLGCTRACARQRVCRLNRRLRDICASLGWGEDPSVR